MNLAGWITKCNYFAYIFVLTCWFSVLCKKEFPCQLGSKTYVSKNLTSSQKHLSKAMVWIVTKATPGICLQPHLFKDLSVKSMVLNDTDIGNYIRRPWKNEKINSESKTVQFLALSKYLVKNISFKSGKLKPPRGPKRFLSRSVVNNLEILRNRDHFKGNIFYVLGINEPGATLLEQKSKEPPTNYPFDTAWNDAVMISTGTNFLTPTIKNQEVFKRSMFNPRKSCLKIINVDRPLFRYMTSLKSSILSLNYASSTITQLLSGFNKLETLHVQRCHEQYIAAKTFYDLCNVRDLQLCENSKGSLPSDLYVPTSMFGLHFSIFYNNVKTQLTTKLSGYRNIIGYSYTIIKSFSLSSLDLSFNKINVVLNDTFLVGRLHTYMGLACCRTFYFRYFSKGQPTFMPCRGGGSYYKVNPSNLRTDSPQSDTAKFHYYLCSSFTLGQRVSRFERCNEYGIRCTKYTKDLAPGYWWKWTNKTELYQFLQFKAIVSNEGQDNRTTSIFPLEKLPRIYKCPFRKACLGGISSNCHKNYTGPLCATCNKNFYNTYLGCHKCPKKSASVLKLLTTPLLILLVALVLRWMETVIIDNRSRRTLADMFLSLTKILLGHYQILAVIIRILSDIKWPTVISDLSRYIYQAFLEVFSFPTLDCIYPTLEISGYEEMVASCFIVIVLPIFFLLVYYLHSCTRKPQACTLQIGNESCQLKRLYFRGLLMIYFIVYPSVCQRIFQVMPFNCLKFCFDGDGRVCQSYLRVDFNVQCPSTDPSNTYVYIGYASLIIPYGFPLLLLIMLRYSHVQLESGNRRNIEENVLVFATRFFYEGYKPLFWYWEVIEMMRKLLFSIGFAFFGLGSRVNLFYMIIISGIATTFYAYQKPMKYKMEHVFHMISLSCLFFTLCVGALLRLEQNYIETIYDSKIDTAVVSIIVVVLSVVPITVILCGFVYSLVNVVYHKLVSK